MNDFPRKILRRIAAKYGKDVGGDARRCASLLNDLCGENRREINVLVNAIEERIPLDLMAGKSLMSPELLLTRLEKRLAENTGMTDEAARWAVESWALALDVVSETQIAERESKTQNQPLPKSAPPIQPPLQNSAPPRPKIVPPVQPPIAAPPVIRQPKPAPPIAKPAPKPPVINQPPIVVEPIVTVRKSFGFFRGCLVTFFLLVVLGVLGFVVAPYALEVMRETQQERNNEPPRFPQ